MLILLSSCDFKIEDKINDGENLFDEKEELVPYPVIINDVVIDSQPNTIISLSPALAELLFEFKAEEKLIARGSYCDYPSPILSKPDVGSSANPNVDEIIKLKPDVLLISTPLASKDLLTMEQHGIKTLYFSSPRTLLEFKGIYESMGVLLNGVFTGAEVGEEFFSEISKACDNNEVINIGDFIYITEDLKVAGGNTFEHSIFSCFGNNLAKEYENYIYDEMEFTEQEPNVILLNDKYSLEDLTGSVYGELSAVKNSRIIYINNLFFERPSRRIVLMIENFISDFTLLLSS